MGVAVLRELIDNSFYFGWVEELILKDSILADVVVLKKLIFNSFYFGRYCGLDITAF